MNSLNLECYFFFIFLYFIFFFFGGSASLLYSSCCKSLFFSFLFLPRNDTLAFIFIFIHVCSFMLV